VPVGGASDPKEAGTMTAMPVVERMTAEQVPTLDALCGE
jgi:hypothetical protein